MNAGGVASTLKALWCRVRGHDWHYTYKRFKHAHWICDRCGRMA